jgi:prepilin-type N-terminal cleavage/methylation domain-containing protein
VKRGGFSLAELLIVIGIVALLAALLFPVIQNAREGGRRTQCLAQMHQLGQSVLAYLADFNETYPMAAYVQHYTHNSTCLFTLYHELVPYIRDKTDSGLPVGWSSCECGARVRGIYAALPCDGL